MRPLGVVLTASALLTLITGLVLRSGSRGAAATAFFVIAFFGYAKFAEFLAPFGALAPWAILTALGMGLAARIAPGARPLNAFALCLLAVALGNLGLSVVHMRRLSAKSASEATAVLPTKGPRPDVFYIILDAHGRADALRRTMDYDERGFVDGLRERGFYVADKARSNYCQTELSIPSSMNMDYIDRLLPNVSPDEEDRSPLPSLLERSAVERRFRAHGYRFLAVTTGFEPIRFPNADARLENERGMTLLERMLFDLTPLASPEAFAPMPQTPQYKPTGPEGSQDRAAEGDRRKITLDAFADLRSLARPTDEPRFVVAHILAPHPPFVFGPNGEPVTIGKYHGVDDFELFYQNVGTRRDYRKGYTGQVAYIDRLVLQTVDTILQAAGTHPRPVIVVQGDHGSRMNSAFLSPDHTDVTECFQNLNAFLVPDAVRRTLWPDITPVNEFRVLFDGLFGDGIPILDERCFYSDKKNPYRFTDVTPYVQRAVPTSEHGAPLKFDKGTSPRVVSR